MTQLTNAALDLIFEPRGATTKRADVGLQTSGVDISNRYMQPSQGGTATAGNTNIKSGGVDIASLFTQIGTVITLPTILWGGLPSLSFAITTAEPGAVAGITVRSLGTTAQDGSGTAAGNFLDSTGAGSGDDFECRYVNLTGDAILGPTVFTTINVDQFFQLIRLSPGTSTCNFTVEIQPIGDSAKRETRAVQLTATQL